MPRDSEATQVPSPLTVIMFSLLPLPPFACPFSRCLHCLRLNCQIVQSQFSPMDNPSCFCCTCKKSRQVLAHFYYADSSHSAWGCLRGLADLESATAALEGYFSLIIKDATFCCSSSLICDWGRSDWQSFNGSLWPKRHPPHYALTLP